MVAMDSGTCRSGRTGSTPRDETFGETSGPEEGQRLRGEMRQPRRGQERIGGDAERGVMMKPPPAAALEVIEAQFILQFLIVAFDPPAPHGQLDELRAGRRRRQRREPVFD